MFRDSGPGRELEGSGRGQGEGSGARERVLCFPRPCFIWGAGPFPALLIECFLGLIEASRRPASAGKVPAAQEGFQCTCPWEFSPVTARR